jgi:hypothetical protein
MFWARRVPNAFEVVEKDRIGHCVARIREPKKTRTSLMQLCCSRVFVVKVLAARIDALASHRRVVESIFVPHEPSRLVDSIRRTTREQFEREKFRASLTRGGSGS